ncbi:MAG TPA: cell envelope integrity protein TolA, partial [Candidatus Macondimonas sp.]|nr:cell envelope integrity protein TolA [Candidatus Macondimonas sp.]
KADAEAKAQAAAEAAAKAKADAEAKARAAEQAAREAAMRAELAAEQAARDAAVRADLLARYVGALSQAVKRNWLRPPVADSVGSFECELRVSQTPAGQVLSAKVVKSCGDPILDRSIEQAVFRASPLPAPPPELVGQTRDLIFEFKP